MMAFGVLMLVAIPFLFAQQQTTADAFVSNAVPSSVAQESSVAGCQRRWHQSPSPFSSYPVSSRRAVDRRSAADSGGGSSKNDGLHHSFCDDPIGNDRVGDDVQHRRRRGAKRRDPEGGRENRSGHDGMISQQASLAEENAIAISRRGVLEGLLAGLLLVGAGWVGGVVGAPAPARAGLEEQHQGGEEGVGSFEEYASPDGSFALRYPASFKGFSKPLKTHKVEVNFRSEEVKGYEVGVAIDPVRIESLEKFGSPEEVGARVLKVEQAKDGTLDTKLFEARAEKQGTLTLYTLDYFVESTRGFKHFVAKVTIKDNLLYACTAQAKEKDYPQVQAQLKRVVESFRVPA